jgi:hypothetical protein
VLWGLRGWRAWDELARLAGVAYLLGVATFGVVVVLELVVGVDLSWLSLALTFGLIAAVGLAVGSVQRRPRPTVRGGGARHGLTLTVAVCAALVVLYFEAMFRFARLHGLYAFDAWHFWVPKAKAIYFFGDLDRQFFTTLPHPSYPPLLPALEASAFHFMGAPDVVTLHLQLWFLAVGFVAAIVGLLSPRVPSLLLWPFVLVVLVAPRIASHYEVAPQADFILDYFFALAALLVALWLLEREAWLLVASTPLLAAVMLTKRDGYALAASVLVAALVVSYRERRFAWPRLAAAGAASLASSIPWPVWMSTHDIGGEGPTGGALGALRHLDRAWPSLRLSLSTLFDFQLWLLAAPLAIAAVVLAFAAGLRRLPGYVALVFVFATLGFTWATWSFTFLPITKDEATNPIVRLTGSLILFTLAVTPLLLASAWQGRER